MPEWPRHLNQEMRQHLDDEYAALRAGGASDAEAMRALAGDLDEIGAPSPVADVTGDVRYALRSLRKHPGFTAVVLATLALGIGANAAIFSVVNAVLLRPLPYEGADRIAVIWGDLHRPGVNRIPASAGEYADYRDRSHAFEHIAVYDTAGFNLTGAGEPEELDGAVVTASLFPLLGATAEVGRTFTAAEEQAWTRTTSRSSATACGRAASTPADTSSGRSSRSTAGRPRLSASCRRASSFPIPRWISGSRCCSTPRR